MHSKFTCCLKEWTIIRPSFIRTITNDEVHENKQLKSTMKDILDTSEQYLYSLLIINIVKEMLSLKF